MTMKDPKICLKCGEIITFCECEQSITDKDKYIKYIESLVDTNNRPDKMSVEEGDYRIVESYDRAIGRTYCGNCVETLPEKTLDKCPYCGVKFKSTIYKP